MSRQWYRWVVFSAALCWLSLVFGFYYAGHKPFSLENISQLGRNLFVLLVSLAVVLVAGGLGRHLRAGCWANPLIRVSMQAAAGMGCISIGWLVLGTVVGINPLLCWVVLVLLALLLRRGIYEWLSDWRACVHVWFSSGKLGKLLALEIGGMLVLSLLMSLAPPITFDSLVYHLTIPQEYLLRGRVHYMPELMFWGMPQVVEIIYTWLMGLGGASAATVTGWIAGALALLGLFGYVTESISHAAGWVAVAALLSGYSFVVLLPSGYVEWFTVWFGVAGLASLGDWYLKSGRRELIWAGVFSGLAAGTKYTAGALTLAMMVVVMAVNLRRGHGKSRLWSDLAHYLLPAVFVFSPWLIKNAVAVINPVYPFFFPSGSMDALRLRYYHLPAWGDWATALLLPVTATVEGFEGAPGFSASISPLLLALSPFAFLGYKNKSREQRAGLRLSGSIGLIGLLVWMFASRLSGFLIQSRLYFVVFPAIAVLAGAGFQALASVRLPGLRLRRIIGTMIALSMGLTLIQYSNETVRRHPLGVLVGVQSQEQYLEQNLGWYFLAMQAIRALPDQSRVLLLWEPRSYYCQPKCVPDEILDRWHRDLASFARPEVILQDWRANFTHILYYRMGAEFVRADDPRYTTSDWLALEDLLAHLPALQDFGGAYQLYALQP